MNLDSRGRSQPRCVSWPRGINPVRLSFLLCKTGIEELPSEGECEIEKRSFLHSASRGLSKTHIQLCDFHGKPFLNSPQHLGKSPSSSPRPPKPHMAWMLPVFPASPHSSFSLRPTDLFQCFRLDLLPQRTCSFMYWNSLSFYLHLVASTKPSDLSVNVTCSGQSVQTFLTRSNPLVVETQSPLCLTSSTATNPVRVQACIIAPLGSCHSLLLASLSPRLPTHSLIPHSSRGCASLRVSAHAFL